MSTAPTTAGEPPAPAVLTLVPEGLWLPPLVVARLARRLAASDLDAALAPAVVVPPGATARALAAGRSRPAALTPVAAGARLRAAGVAREGADLAVDGEVVVVGEGATVALDDGAIAADARAGALAAAEPGTWPAWRTAPVVLVCAGRPDDVAHDDLLVHRLGDLGLDAVLATVAAPPPSPRATACRLDADALAVVRPDVVVADAATGLLVEGWCTTRWTTIVEVDGSLGDRCELLPWSPERRRLRARIGTGCPPATLAALVRRLASGPPPELPLAPDGDGPAAGPPTRRRPPAAVAATVLGASAAAPVVATWPSIGVAVSRGPMPGADGPAASSSASARAGREVLVVGADATDAQLTLATRRAEAGEPVLAVVAPHDLEATSAGEVALRPDAVAAVTAAGRALVPSPAAGRAVHRLGACAQVVPPTPSWSRLEEAAAAAAGRTEGPATVGWLLDERDPEAAAALAAATTTVPGLRVDLVGGADAEPGPDGPPSADRRADLDLAVASRWSAAVWSPRPGRAATGDVTAVVELALLGVPLVARADDAAALGALGRGVAPVTDLGLLLSAPDARRRRGRDLRDRAAALHGARAAAVAAHRALGWALAPHPR